MALVGATYALAGIVGDTIDYYGVTYTLTENHMRVKVWDGGIRGGRVIMKHFGHGYWFRFEKARYTSFADAATKAQAYQLSKYVNALEFVRDWNR